MDAASCFILANTFAPAGEAEPPKIAVRQSLRPSTSSGSPALMPRRRARRSASDRAKPSGLVFEKQVEARCHKKDRYGRDVCAVTSAGATLA